MIIPTIGNLEARIPRTPKDIAVNPAFFNLSSHGISSSRQSTIRTPIPIPSALPPITLLDVPYLIGFLGALIFLNFMTAFLNPEISSVVLSIDFSLATRFLNSGCPQ